MGWDDMMKGRTTEQKVSIVVWLALLLAMLFLIFLPNPDWMDWAWCASVLGLEVTAGLWGGLPLSPIMQAIDDRGATDAPWYKGPRAVATTVAAFMALYYGYTIQNLADNYWMSAIAVVAVLGLFGFNYYHWTRPEKFDA